MRNDELENRRKLASKLTKISAISLLIGGSWAWFIVSEGGPEALGAIMPLMVVGGIHLIAGPAAIYQAFVIHRLSNCLYVYMYFALFLIATFVLFPAEILGYIIVFVLFTAVPIILSLIMSLFNKAS